MHQESHATLLVLNIIAWLNEDPAYFHDKIKGTSNQQLKPYVQQMKENLSFYTKNWSTIKIAEPYFYQSIYNSPIYFK